MKWHSTWFEIKELQIRTIMRYLLRWLKFRMLTLTSIDTDTELDLSYTGDRIKNGTVTKILLQCLTKLNIHVPCYQAILLVGIYPREMKSYVHTKTWTQMLCDLCVIAKNWKLKCPSVGEYKHTVVHPYYGILRSNKKEQTIDIHNNFHGSQGNYFMWKVTYYMTIHITFKKRQTDRDGNLISGCKSLGVREGVPWSWAWP